MIDVLVVDDDFMVAGIHARFVERIPGFVVAGTARTGAEALQMCADLAPGLLLLDVHLPDMSGLDVLQALRSSGSTVGVVMVTAERDAEAVSAALHGGAMQYLVKPFEFDDFAARMQRVHEALTTLAHGAPDQAAIDRAFGGHTAAATSLPKGLSPESARLVEKALTEVPELSAADCGERVGLSRVSARRYLEHFVDRGLATVRLNYGNAGRPERRYRSTRQ
ncbi:response regulator [Aeromicrobium chenweiae]|uniref:Transcriptional regulatory protein n=1 Tax=Aeromicrobium chenweiae TaxID=2079793 RepID=A0A2S0WML5_9ACTN|nr:response regulator [Aeromicrobium chenweiae]AWB92504.1 two-component system response regulator [Aeromicrobium chenweiae]TGN33490.1 response regulator [Aeromicrobium chenweiae]